MGDYTLVRSTQTSEWEIYPEPPYRVVIYIDNRPLINLTVCGAMANQRTTKRETHHVIKEKSLRNSRLFIVIDRVINSALGTNLLHFKIQTNSHTNKKCESNDNH